MYGFGASLAPLIGDNSGIRIDIERQPAGDEIKEVGPEAATVDPHTTYPGPDDFGFDIFGGP